MKIYLSLNNSEIIFLKCVDSLSAAKEYIESNVQDAIRVDNEHNCTNDVFYSSKVCQFQVYSDDIINDDGICDEPIYLSKYYYTDTISN